MDQRFPDDQEKFDAAELSRIHEDLAKLRQQVIDLEEQNKEYRRDAEQIRVLIEELANAAYAMPKKAWYRAAISKFFKLSKQALFATIIKKLLEAASDALQTLGG